MENKESKKVYVVGHKNPDTDSICSAIAYANLKQQVTGGRYEAKRAGDLNGETTYVLEHFGVEAPAYLSDVHLQVKDLDIRRIAGVMGQASIKEAWSRMREENIRTLPILRGDRLEGLITIGDIANS